MTGICVTRLSARPGPRQVHLSLGMISGPSGPAVVAGQSESVKSTTALLYPTPAVSVVLAWRLSEAVGRYRLAAMIVGLSLFGENPGWTAVLGASVIIASGPMGNWRARRPARDTAPLTNQM